MLLDKAIEGFLIDRRSRPNLSPLTVRQNEMSLRIFFRFMGEVTMIEDVTSNDLKRYLDFLRNSYKPNRINKENCKPLAPSTIDNHWKALRRLFIWSKEVLGTDRPDIDLERPQYQLPQVNAFTETEIKRLLFGCEFSAEAETKGNRRGFKMRRPTAKRDKALVLFLLDTGLRVSEVARMNIEDVNLETGECLVAPWGSGQKTKPRAVYLGQSARRALWLYLAKRDRYDDKESLFDLPISSIRSFLWRLGERVKVPNVHPHKFRHTFAIMYLRNGGDVFTLQRLLGHSTLDMVRHYLDLADADSENAHRKASPVDRWKL